MSLTFFAKSKRHLRGKSLDGQVLWKRKPSFLCAVEIIGAAMAVAAPTVVAALLRKRRRGATVRGLGLFRQGCLLSDENVSSPRGFKPVAPSKRVR